ncbi:LysR family transcriptional regulator [Chondromyces apiculatus]|uniref:Transcriptional regulator, LysR family n=1 Tax=Chondromyces apiculatus DSM 436 TaxID=1192034 RepID=A0A017SXF9_9BACT|nr:LysR family transcriptional regulator [Chondromyces apiculatus]EYF00986.1 transcriptional regulator, LysR family [Chondromyces apiculatus DSM 436]
MPAPRMDFSRLSAFVAVATHRNFRRAAVELQVTPSALSHAVRELEESLGVRLLHRTSRSVSPTEAGERLMKRLAGSFAEITDALEEVNAFRDTPTGTLRLNAAHTAAELVLAPLMGRFLQAHPQMHLEIVCDDGLVDVVAAGFDAGVRFGESLQQDMIAVPIGPEQRWAVVGSPAYVARKGRPETPHDLKSHACIRYRFQSGALFHWEFEKDRKELSVDVAGPLTLGDQNLMIRAALDGVGLAFVFENLVAPHLAGGQLVRVLDGWCPPFPGMFLYYPSRRQMSGGLRAFIEMARAEGKQAGR